MRNPPASETGLGGSATAGGTGSASASSLKGGTFARSCQMTSSTPLGSSCAAASSTRRLNDSRPRLPGIPAGVMLRELLTSTPHRVPRRYNAVQEAASHEGGRSGRTSDRLSWSVAFSNCRYRLLGYRRRPESGLTCRDRLPGGSMKATQRVHPRPPPSGDDRIGHDSYAHRVQSVCPGRCDLRPDQCRPFESPEGMV
jgi:hypothetical protein